MLNYMLVQEVIDNFRPQTAPVSSPNRKQTSEASGEQQKQKGPSSRASTASDVGGGGPNVPPAPPGAKKSSNAGSSKPSSGSVAGGSNSGKKSSKEPSGPPVSMAELEVYHKKFIGPGQGQIAASFLIQIRFISFLLYSSFCIYFDDATD